MKIIHLISSINRGGAENHLFNLALKQSEDKNKVKIIYFKGDGYWSKFYKKKIEIFKYKLHNNFNIFRIIYLLIKLSYFLKKRKSRCCSCSFSITRNINNNFKII